MRGPDDKQGMMFTTVSPEKRVPKDHPLRKIKALAEAILKRLSPTFDAHRGMGIAEELSAQGR